MTFNLVPSLLVQLEAFAANRAHDRTWNSGSSRRPISPRTSRLHPPEFLPRASPADDRRLSALRGAAGEARRAVAAARQPRRGRPPFSGDDLRDLQVWQKLAWLDPFYLDDDERVRGLVSKERDYQRRGQALLRDVELEILNAVIPAYRAAAARGPDRDFDLAVLPPDSAAALRHRHLQADPSRFARCRGNDSGTRRTRSSSDARCGLSQRLFGAAPTGLWPSEGSVSDAMVPLVARAGFKWMATDELILARTLGIAFGPRRARAGRSTRAAVHALYGARRRGARRVPVPRPRSCPI